MQAKTPGEDKRNRPGGEAALCTVGTRGGAGGGCTRCTPTRPLLRHMEPPLPGPALPFKKQPGHNIRCPWWDTWEEGAREGRGSSGAHGEHRRECSGRRRPPRRCPRYQQRVSYKPLRPIILSDAWKAVTIDTIRNCFRHAGFVLDSEDSATGHELAAELPPYNERYRRYNDDNVLVIDERYQRPPCQWGYAVTFEQFANFDSAILPCAEVYDEIVRQVLEPSQVDSDSDDDAPPTPQPSSADLVQALTTLFSVYSDSQTLWDIQADLIAPS
ncbi:hypothetical protein HPB49_013956 [Dermacentor silvarum]|uniref:Uncharacterized protein n=1 Tax=Dermacentor silvarum TaxID=543639 RepID=A0ACB8D5S7_DERSI|nr:hypothetical protein HPB49_013956 [Dermacentor silvarum]